MEGLSSSHGTCIESCLDQCRQLYKTFPADICLAVLLGFIIGNACRGISEIWSACVCKWLKSLFICIRTAFIRGLVQWLTYRGYEVTPKEDGQKDTGSYVKRHPHVTHDTVKKTGALPPLLLNSLKNTPVTSPRLIGCSTSTSPVAFCISPCSCSLGSDSSLSPCSVFANMALPRSGPVSPLQSMADATRKRSNLRPPSAVPNLKAFDARNRLISSADIRDRLEDAAASCDVRYPASKYFNVQRSEASSWACTPVQTPSGPACSVRFEANDEDNSVIGERENRTFLPVAVWMCGPDLAHLTLDRGSGWLDHVAPSLEEIYGPEWEQNIHGEDLNRCRVLICSALETKAPFQLEYRLKAQTNQYRWILDTCKIRTSDDGAFLGFVGWRIDIHERKLIEFEHESYWSLPCEFFVRLGSDMEHFELISPSMPHMLGLRVKYLGTRLAHTSGLIGQLAIYLVLVVT